MAIPFATFLARLEKKAIKKDMKQLWFLIAFLAIELQKGWPFWLSKQIEEKEKKSVKIVKIKIIRKGVANKLVVIKTLWSLPCPSFHLHV